MIKHYLEENFQLTNEKINLSQNYFDNLNLSFNQYYDIYDNIEINNQIEYFREYYNIFGDISNIDFIKECLKEGIKRLIEEKPYDEEINKKINE